MLYVGMGSGVVMMVCGTAQYFVEDDVMSDRFYTAAWIGLYGFLGIGCPALILLAALNPPYRDDDDEGGHRARPPLARC